MNIGCIFRSVLPLRRKHRASHKLHHTFIIAFNDNPLIFVHPQMNDMLEGSHSFELNDCVILMHGLDSQHHNKISMLITKDAPKPARFDGRTHPSTFTLSHPKRGRSIMKIGQPVELIDLTLLLK